MQMVEILTKVGSLNNSLEIVNGWSAKTQWYASDEGWLCASYNATYKNIESPNKSTGLYWISYIKLFKGWYLFEYCKNTMEIYEMFDKHTLELHSSRYTWIDAQWAYSDFYLAKKIL